MCVACGENKGLAGQVNWHSSCTLTVHATYGSTLLWAAGDVVQTDDVVAQIETDKVTIDMRYTGSKPGLLKSLQISEDQEVQVDQVVGIIDDDVTAVEAAGGVAAQHVRPLYNA